MPQRYEAHWRKKYEHRLDPVIQPSNHGFDRDWSPEKKLTAEQAARFDKSQEAQKRAAHRGYAISSGFRQARPGYHWEITEGPPQRQVRADGSVREYPGKREYREVPNEPPASVTEAAASWKADDQGASAMTEPAEAKNEDETK